MIILSVDIAWSKDIAYAVFHNRKLEFYDKVKDFDEIFKTKADVVVTEDPYPKKIKKYSYKGHAETFKQLCKAVGVIEYLAKKYKSKFRLIKPLEWKSHWKLTQKTPVHFQETIRVGLIKSVTDKLVDDEDIQDAILIGMYYVNRKVLEEEEYDQALF